MHLVARQASVTDFDAMMRLCRHHNEPVEPNRREWEALWRADSTVGVVVDDITRNGPDRALAIMLGVFITDPCLRTLLAAKEPFIHGRLAASSASLVPIRDFGALNSGDGLNMVIAYVGWEGEKYYEAPAPNIRAVVVNAFADRHGGNRLKWLLGEVGGVDLLDLTHRSGGTVLNDYAEWAEEHGMESAPRRPYLVGVHRDDALESENQWLIRMFTYFPPRFHFTEPQRRILALAREGFTDAEVAQELGVSADAVKKRWGTIYDRVKEVFPNLLPASPLGGRGVEKRRALISHLRERPEELRPYERRFNEPMPEHLQNDRRSAGQEPEED